MRLGAVTSAGRHGGHLAPATVALVLVAGLLPPLLLAAAPTQPVVAVAAVMALAALAVAIVAPLAMIALGILAIPLEGFAAGLVGPSQGVLGLAAMGYLLRWAFASPGTLPRHPAVAAFGLLMVANVAGLVLAPEPAVVARQVVTWGTLLIVVAALALSARERDCHRLAFAFVLCGGLAGLVAIFDPQSATGDLGSATVLRATAGLGSPNALGMLLALTLPIAVVFVLRGGPLLAPIALGCAGLALTGMTLAVSRGSFLGLGTGLVVLAFWPPFRKAALLALPVVLVLALVGNNPVSPIGGKVVERLSDAKTTQTNPRLALWEAAPEMVADRPIFGIGALEYTHYAPEYGLATREGVATHAHNLLLTIVIENGVLGLLGLVGLLAAAAASLRRVVRLGRGLSAGLGYGMAAALAGFFVNGIFDYGLAAAPLAALFFGLIGCAVGLQGALERQATPARLPHPSSLDLPELARA